MNYAGVKKNLIYQFAYQFIILILPLIVAPYLTRTLGKTPLGLYAYANSIAYYFVVVAMLGITRHGQRIIASHKDDETLLRKTFWSLFILHVLFSILAITLFAIFVIFFIKDNQSIYFILALYVLSALFDITWFYFGMEKFKTVIVRNLVIKLLETAAIFLFVKSNNDILLYTLIMSGSILISQILLFIKLVREVKFIKVSKKDIREHLSPLFVLSLSVIAISIYTVFNKTLLGILTNTDNIALYEYSNKIITIPRTIISVIGIVLFPRSSYYFSKNDINSVKKQYNYSILIVYFLAWGSIFGLLGISNLFVSLYYGPSFASTGEIIKAMSPIILIIGIGDIFRVQFLLPMKKDFVFTISIVINAVLNISLSFLLIPKFGVFGAVLSSIIAEFIGLLYQGFLIAKYINVKKTLMMSIPFIVSGIFMFIIIEYIKNYYNISISHLAIQVVVGTGSYIVLIFVWFTTFSKSKNLYRELLKKSFTK